MDSEKEREEGSAIFQLTGEWISEPVYFGLTFVQHLSIVIPFVGICISKRFCSVQSLTWRWLVVPVAYFRDYIHFARLSMATAEGDEAEFFDASLFLNLKYVLFPPS